MTDPCPHSCRDGFYTASIPIADAVISDQRPCPIHGAARMQLVRDSATDRIGEIRDYFTKQEGEAVWLRPLNGEPEWPALVSDLRSPTPGSKRTT